MIECERCGFQFNIENESKAHLHHLFPKEWGGTDKDGRIYLCGHDFNKDCHRKIHNWLNVEFKEPTTRIKGTVIYESLKWLKNESRKTVEKRRF